MQKAAMRKRRGKKRARPEHEFGGKGEEDRGGVKSVREVLHVPANPARQRAILIVVVHGGEIAPGSVAAGELHHAGFEIDAKPFPEQQKKAGARGRMPAAQARTESGRGEEKRDESCLEQHAVGLIAREILRRA